jgi:hypothetical protein
MHESSMNLIYIIIIMLEADLIALISFCFVLMMQILCSLKGKNATKQELFSIQQKSRTPI